MTLKREEHDTVDLAALEDVLLRLDQLQVVLGASVGHKLARIRGALIEAMAARDRADHAAAIAGIGKAMDVLSSLADDLDPAEGAMMRMVAQRFRAALLRGDYGHAKETAGLMREKSGAVERKKK